MHIYTEHNKRVNGKSNYSITKLLKLWMNGFTNFSVKPLRVSILFGVISALVGFIFAVYVIIQRLLNPAVQLGWTSIIVAVLILSGVQLISIGMLGEYVGRIFIFQNRSPQYIIKELFNLDSSNNSKN